MGFSATLDNFLGIKLFSASSDPAFPDGHTTSVLATNTSQRICFFLSAPFLRNLSHLESRY